MVIKNVSDGCEVAEAISLYVNSYSTPRACFYECMLDKDTSLQHNFTALCMDWFAKYASINYDDRNLASVLYAKSIEHFTVLKKRKLSSRGINVEFEFDSDNDESAAALFERYLRLSENNDAFIQKMLYAHRTLQQRFSRMCCEWFKCVSKLPSKRTQYIVIARNAVSKYTEFPLI